MTDTKKTDSESTKLPPIFKTWNQMYITVLVWQGLLIIMFYSFMRYFS